MKLFSESEKSSFAYWFAHWRAYNLTAMLLGVWKFKYLFHDIEKPFLMFIWRDYPRVKAFHRKHARHHWSYEGNKGYDYLGMVIDWECSRFSKATAQMNAYETSLWDKAHYLEHAKDIEENIDPILKELGLYGIRNAKIDLNASRKP